MRQGRLRNACCHGNLWYPLLSSAILLLTSLPQALAAKHLPFPRTCHCFPLWWRGCGIRQDQSFWERFLSPHYPVGRCPGCCFYRLSLLILTRQWGHPIVETPFLESHLVAHLGAVLKGSIKCTTGFWVSTSFNLTGMKARGLYVKSYGSCRFGSRVASVLEMFTSCEWLIHSLWRLANVGCYCCFPF